MGKTNRSMLVTPKCMRECTCVCVCVCSCACMSACVCVRVFLIAIR